MKDGVFGYTRQLTHKRMDGDSGVAEKGTGYIGTNWTKSKTLKL